LDDHVPQDDESQLGPAPPKQDESDLDPVREKEYWEVLNTNIGLLGLAILVGVFGLVMGYVIFSSTPRVRNLILLLTPVTVIAIIFMARYIVYSYNRDKKKLDEQQNPYHRDHRIR
jgi:uncharacterized membrane protein